MVTFIDEWRRKFPSCMVVKRLKEDRLTCTIVVLHEHDADHLFITVNLVLSECLDCRQYVISGLFRELSISMIGSAHNNDFREIPKFVNLSSLPNSRKYKPREYHRIYSIFDKSTSHHEPSARWKLNAGPHSLTINQLWANTWPMSQHCASLYSVLKRYTDTIWNQCWTVICDSGLTLGQRWVGISCLPV